jgi:type I restriction enzyme S subunit
MKSSFPIHWPMLSLQEVADIQTGIALGNDNYPSPVEFPYLRVANVQDGFLDLKEIKSLKIDRVKAERFKLQFGDVLVTEGGDFDKLGRGHVWRNEVSNCLHQNHIFAIRPKPGRLESYFLSAVIGSNYGKRYFLGCAKKSTNLASINSTELKQMLVPLPSLEEQQAIGCMIELWEGAENNVVSLIESKRTLKLGLMQELLRGSQSQGVKGWREYKLKELFTERDETNGADLPLLSITSDRGVVPRSEIGRKDSSSDDKTAYKRILPGDIGYNTMRMWQGVSGLSTFEGIISPAYTVCTPNTLVDGKFASYLFKFPSAVHLFHRYSQGLVDDTLSLKFPNFGEIKIRIPSVKDQQHIASVLAAADIEIELLDAWRQELLSQKKALIEQVLRDGATVKKLCSLLESRARPVR